MAGNEQSRPRLVDYLTPEGRRKITTYKAEQKRKQEERECEVGRNSFLNALSPFRQVIDKLEPGGSQCIDEKSKVTDEGRDRKKLTVTLRKADTGEIIVEVDSRHEDFVIGELRRAGPHLSSPMYRDSYTALTHEVDVVIVGADNKIAEIRSGRKWTREDYFEAWGDKSLAKAEPIDDLAKGTDILIQVASHLPSQK
jgi:hypothetical protein